MTDQRKRLSEIEARHNELPKVPPESRWMAREYAFTDRAELIAMLKPYLEPVDDVEIAEIESRHNKTDAKRDTPYVQEFPNRLHVDRGTLLRALRQSQAECERLRVEVARQDSHIKTMRETESGEKAAMRARIAKLEAVRDAATDYIYKQNTETLTRLRAALAECDD